MSGETESEDESHTSLYHHLSPIVMRNGSDSLLHRRTLGHRTCKAIVSLRDVQYARAPRMLTGLDAADPSPCFSTSVCTEMAIVSARFA
jgi:hypothetical protein